jgi:ribonuclease-3
VASPATELAARLGLSFRNLALLDQALIHSSYVNEHPEGPGLSNERLEFLGDAVLSLIISEALWARHPDEPEGLLTTRRAAIVSARGLSRLAGRLDLGSHLVLGLGATRSGERARDSVLASVFEAVVAAIYLDLGLAAVRDWVLGVAAPELDAEAPPLVLKAPKSRLQEYAYRISGRLPAYRIVSVEGPDHDRHYAVEVSIGGQVLGRGEGPNRREAETVAAAAALVGLATEEAGADAAAREATPRDAEAAGRSS